MKLLASGQCASGLLCQGSGWLWDMAAERWRVSSETPSDLNAYGSLMCFGKTKW